MAVAFGGRNLFLANWNLLYLIVIAIFLDIMYLESWTFAKVREWFDEYTERASKM